MNWWQGLVLGVVQGLTEFLPISSSGHLVIAQELLAFESRGVAVEILVHVATLIAVAIVYRNKIAWLFVGLVRGRREALSYVGLIALATVPAVAVGFGLEDVLVDSFESLTVVGVNLIVTGAILWSTRWAPAGDPLQPRPRPAFLVGAAQAFAILPGISRSGSTIAAGMWLRWSPEAAAEFSFIMAIPAIAGAAVLRFPDLAQSGSDLGWFPAACAFVAALVTGVWAIRFLVGLLRRRALHLFAPYCLAVGGVALIAVLI